MFLACGRPSLRVNGLPAWSGHHNDLSEISDLARDLDDSKDFSDLGQRGQNSWQACTFAHLVHRNAWQVHKTLKTNLKPA